MFQGELFACRHYLHISDIIKREVKFIFQDVACRYRMWVERVDPESSTKATFALNVMHGTGTDKTQHLQLFYFMGDFLGLKQNRKRQDGTATSQSNFELDMFILCSSL